MNLHGNHSPPSHGYHGNGCLDAVVSYGDIVEVRQVSIVLASLLCTDSIYSHQTKTRAESRVGVFVQEMELPEYGSLSSVIGYESLLFVPLLNGKRQQCLFPVCLNAYQGWNSIKSCSVDSHRPHVTVASLIADVLPQRRNTDNRQPTSPYPGLVNP